MLRLKHTSQYQSNLDEVTVGIVANRGRMQNHVIMLQRPRGLGVTKAHFHALLCVRCWLGYANLPFEPRVRLFHVSSPLGTSTSPIGFHERALSTPRNRQDPDGANSYEMMEQGCSLSDSALWVAPWAKIAVPSRARV